MTSDTTARAATRIAAMPDAVWRALTDPAEVKKYYFGTDLETDWKPGSRITWSGEWQGKKYQDHGEVLEVERGRRMKYTHFSPLMRRADEPANYHTITVDLEPDGAGTRVTLVQDNNADAKSRDQSQKNWEMVLEGLKKLLEGAR